ncbi:MAG: hypothetical protein AB1540_14915 [Bdellovibrionota bacterium]
MVLPKNLSAGAEVFGVEGEEFKWVELEKKGLTQHRWSAIGNKPLYAGLVVSGKNAAHSAKLQKAQSRTQ